MSASRNAQVKAVVYWVSPSGELMIAPHTDILPHQLGYRMWHRVECHSVTEIENFSRRFRDQQAEKFRSMKIEEHLRSQARRERLRANCRLRIASGCVSEADEVANRRILQSLDRQDDFLFKMVSEAPENIIRGCLEIEKKEESTAISAYKLPGDQRKMELTNG